MAPKGSSLLAKLTLIISAGAAAACLALGIQLYRHPGFIHLNAPGATLLLTLCIALGIPAGLVGIIAGAVLARRCRALGLARRKINELSSHIDYLEEVQLNQRARLDELSTLREVAYVVNRESDFSIIAQKVLQLISELLEPLDACIFVVEDPGAPPVPFLQYNRGKFLSGRKIAIRAIPNFNLGQFESHSLLCRAYSRQLHAIVPLKVDEEVLGVLLLIFPTDGRSAREQEHEFNEARRTLLQEIAQHISLAVKTKHLRMKSVVDGLTGLFSKSHFAAQLEAQLELADRKGADFSLVVFDIDHFKRINDTYGHATGDVILSGIAGRIRRALRKYDSAYRTGGEEMAVLLPRSDLAQATRIAERIRTRIQNKKFTASGHRRVLVTVSCGVAQCRKGDTAEMLFERADKRLYEAKQAGRNRVVPKAA